MPRLGLCEPCTQRAFTIPEPSLRQMTHEPARGERSDALQCARLFEQVRNSRNDRQFFFALELTTGFLIELADVEIGGHPQRRRRADLIVTGAYGPSRLKELVMGGATRTMMGSMAVPVLLSH